MRESFGDALRGITQAEEWLDVQAQHVPSRLEQAAAQLPAPATIDAEPEPVADESPTVSADYAAKFRKGVASKRAPLPTSMSNGDFLAAVVSDFTGGASSSFEELAQESAERLATSLHDGAYDWETGERIPDTQGER